MEIPDLRAPEDPLGCQDHLANQEEGVVLELMEPEECQENQGLRVTVVSMAFLGCQETRVTGVTQEESGLLDHLERTERGETMETSDPEDFQVNQGPVVCLGLKVLTESLDLLVCVETTGPMVLRGTWDPKESQVLLASREEEELRECQDLRELTDLQERRVQQESQVFQGCPELTDPRVTQERRGLPVPRVTRAPSVPRGPSVILALVG